MFKLAQQSELEDAIAKSRANNEIVTLDWPREHWDDALAYIQVEYEGDIDWSESAAILDIWGWTEEHPSADMDFRLNLQDRSVEQY